MILQTLDPTLVEAVDNVSTGTKIFLILLVIIFTVLPALVSTLITKPDKQRQRQLMEGLTNMSGKIDTLSSDIKLLVEQMRISVDHYDENLSRRQVDELVPAFMSCHLNQVFLHIREVINKNHIDNNQEQVRSKLKDVVKTNFTTMFRALSYYKYDGQILTTFINKKWSEEASIIIEKYVFNKRMAQTKKLDEISSYLNRKVVEFSDEFMSKIDILNE